MTRPTIFKHKWWRFWRRSYLGLNPWRWETPDLTKDFEIDGFYHPNDGLRGKFGISRPPTNNVNLEFKGEWYAERVDPDTQVKWFGGEE